MAGRTVSGSKFVASEDHLGADRHHVARIGQTSSISATTLSSGKNNLQNNKKEIVGTLLGRDDFVNMVLEDVTEYEIAAEGRMITKLNQMLLNGNNITMLVPGGGGPEV
ncbi:U6 snRNA-associated Sm-like protein LSm5 [Phyllostomus discolor]|uniref:U6 snRNA-associated Sm-like protein LSm5 n=1 Tax=Phyllostomus discolor TaxID=89673 RepID=A0A7E6E3E9_9CHIR|nr:U6 snRNA-associated Sm-like protein LSm5 [Phyllostomus discolor]